MNDLLVKAIYIATKAHEGQLDKSGMPYIGHVMRVMEAGNTIDEKIIGVLHDIVEDTDWTFEQLEQGGFPKHIVDAIRCLTKTSEDEPYDEFIRRVKANRLATQVKINDLTDNMDIKRLDRITDRDKTRLNKYLRAYNQLISRKDYSISTFREDYPNAYQPWTSEDDDKLELLWCEGKRVKELSEIFGRNRGAVQSRIKKLELKEKYE